MHTKELVRFLGELSQHNQRPWFLANKPRYDILREEFLLLVSQVIEQVGQFDKAVADANPKKALFRINRDIRFSKDKSPYKTHFSAAFSATGLKKPGDGGGPAYYFHIDAKGILLFGAGEYMPPPSRLKAIRQYIVDNPQGFSQMLKNKAITATYTTLNDEDKLARPPKGFSADSIHAEWLKYKSFGVWKEIQALDAEKNNLQQVLSQGFQDAYALVQWLRNVPFVNPG